MKAEIYWLPDQPAGRLGIMARPRGGDWLDDEIASWKREPVDLAVSLLSPAEVAELNLRDEASICHKHGIEFISFPMLDKSVPDSLTHARTLVSKIGDALSEGKNVAIHCRMGIGRSALMVASVLVTQGVSVDDAFHRIGAVRGLAVPDTDEQVQWVRKFAEQRGDNKQ
jgi:protein-tyrosine phosphatase